MFCVVTEYWLYIVFLFSILLGVNEFTYKQLTFCYGYEYDFAGTECLNIKRNLSKCKYQNVK